MNLYRLFFITGRTEIIEGPTLADAFIEAGLSAEQSATLVDYEVINETEVVCQ